MSASEEKNREEGTYGSSDFQYTCTPFASMAVAFEPRPPVPFCCLRIPPVDLLNSGKGCRSNGKTETMHAHRVRVLCTEMTGN